MPTGRIETLSWEMELTRKKAANRRAPLAALRRYAALAGIAAFTTGCAGTDDGSTSDTAATARDAAPHVPSGARHAVSAVQVGAFSDSATAWRLRDSLTRAGWRAVATAGESNGRPIWRVRVASSLTPGLPRLIAHTLNAQRRDAVVVQDSANASELMARLIPVNNGTHGMAARIRWAHSADRRVMLVVEDPAAVEAEPIPNGFVLATEKGGLAIQRDSVWDVSPSGDWTRLAYGRSAGAFAREGDALTAQQWSSMARKIGLPEEVVRREAFPISGMNYASGVARAAVIAIPDAPGEEPRARDLPLATGWRVRWLRSGDGLALGTAPKMVQDDQPPSSWIVVDAATGSVRDTLPPSSGPVDDDSRFAEIRWEDGPTLDISIPLDTTSERVLPVDGGRIVSRGGWIRSERTGGSDTRIVGPGTLLAVTRGGRYIAALAPAPDAKEYEAKVQVVVYEVPE